MKLYWKVFTPLAATVLALLALVAWFAGTVLPNQLARKQAETASEFQAAFEALPELTPEAAFSLADSIGVRVRLIPVERMRNGRRPDQPLLPGTLIIPARPGFPYTVVGMVPVLRARLWIVPGSVALLLLLMAAVLHTVLRGVFIRIGNLEKAASLLGRGDTSIRVAPGNGKDELDALGEGFNGMAERIEKLVRAHGELTGSVAHEIRTPLARLSLALELLRESETPGEEMLARMELDIAALDEFMTELLEYNRLNREHTLNREPVDLVESAEDVVASASWGREDVNVTISGNAVVETDRKLLTRALSNMVSNAFRYATATVELEVRRSRDGVSISVLDDGPGFPGSILARAFEPFNKGRESRGTGLGLSIARRIASLLGGDITAGNRPEGGARITLTVPE